MAPPTAPLRAASPPAPLPAPLRAPDPPSGGGRLTAPLIAISLVALVILAGLAWSLVPTLYVRPDGVRAVEPPRAAELRDDLRRVALRLAQPVTIRRR